MASPPSALAAFSVFFIVILATGVAGEECFETNVDYPGEDIYTCICPIVFDLLKAVHVETKCTTPTDCGYLWTQKPSPKACQDHCAATEGCKVFTFSTKSERCYLKNKKGDKTVAEEGAISGPRECPGAAAALAIKTPVSTASPEEIWKNCVDFDADYPGMDQYEYMMVHTPNPALCQRHCKDNTGCNFFTWSEENNRCYLKEEKSGVEFAIGCVSGPSIC